MNEQLSERHKTERLFHDQAAGHARTDFYAWGALRLADEYALSRLGDVRGKRVLEMGCGSGANAVTLARQGAWVQTVDLSAGMAAATRQRTLAAGVGERVHVHQMSAEYLGFADRSFDAIFGHSVLHHTELANTRGQVIRLLKPGGRAVFLEPLIQNPFITIYRHLTPRRRTPTEKPLRLGDVSDFGEPFASMQHREFYLLALGAFGLIPLGSARLFQAALDPMNRLDRVILEHWPWLQRYAWVTVIELTR